MNTGTLQVLAAAALTSISSTNALATALPVDSGQKAATDAAGSWSFHHEGVLGTSLAAVVRAGSRGDARKAERAALAEFDRANRTLSAWDGNSEFSQWQKTRGVAVKVSPLLLQTLAAFDRWSAETGGALNASSEAAAAVWRSSAATGRRPSAEQLTGAVQQMGRTHWVLDQAAGTATRTSDAPLALATFVKSSITSLAADAALAHGATGVMLNVGGDIVTRGSLTQRVDIANPAADAENAVPLETVTLNDRSIATSGDYRRGFDLAGERLSHIIDPRTAMPARGVRSSTVIARDAATAGALATALSVLTPSESTALIARHPGAEYMLVTDDGERIASKGWDAYSEGHVDAAAYRVKAGAAAPVAGGLFNPAYELILKVDLPQGNSPRFRRPYVAAWVEDKDRYPVRTVALWFAKARWLNELRAWYRDDQIRNLSEGTDLSTTISSATRPGGSYTLRWDGKDNAGKLVKAGKYTICIEAAREHGGYSLVRQEIDFNGTPQAMTLPASEELGAVALDYRKH